ncbi:hypothetical protein BDW72DRAFT_159968 [Aspergillus terricola var. indicus]
MCFYQPNPPGCACAFHQLIQPCPSATTYPPPEPTKNPNPLVKVCGMREFAKGVGIRICLGCQSRYAGMNNMGARVGVGMGKRLGYNVSSGMGYMGFNCPGWNAGQQIEQKTDGVLKKNKARSIELAMERGVATVTATAPASIASPILETRTVFATGPGTGPEVETSLMVRRKEPKPDSRRLGPYPNPKPVSKGPTAVLPPVPESAKATVKEIPTPTPTPMPNDLGNRKDKGESQGQVQECSQVMGDLGEPPESQSLLLRYDPVPKATVESLPPGVERRPTTATVSKTGTDICNGKDNTAAEKITEEVSDLPRIEEARAMKVDNESQAGMNGRHGSMGDIVERLAMTLA